MPAEENKALVRRWIEEAFNRGNVNIVSELFATNYVNHDPGTPGLSQGPEGAKQFVTRYRSAFPDARITIEEMFAEGDKVVTRWTASGTQRGSLPGIPATGKQSTVSGITISRIMGGKIAEDYLNWDTLGMLQQLGVFPAPPPTATVSPEQRPMP